MSSIAQSAVFVSSEQATKDLTKELLPVEGPFGGFHDPATILEYYQRLGFQASHWHQACRISKSMLKKQAPSRLPQIGAVVPPESSEEEEFVYPTIFMGITANLIGTGCREAVRFLCKHGVVPRKSGIGKGQLKLSRVVDVTFENISFLLSEREKALFPENDAQDAPLLTPENEEANACKSFIGALVVSGGGIEHDIRRACMSYRIGKYASEDCVQMASTILEEKKEDSCCMFGNIQYDTNSNVSTSGDCERKEGVALFDTLMCIFVSRLLRYQQEARAVAKSKPIPEAYYDVCTWTLTPSEVWFLGGLWLPFMLEEALQKVLTVSRNTSGAINVQQEALSRAKTCLIYWAARQGVPIFCPSFADGDIMSFLLRYHSGERESSLATGIGTCSDLLQLDLVRDIHVLNKFAMLSKKTGMIICGGGVVKHHVCNANLMRNGADFTVILNNGQEFDGSDAGAKPEEAVSWGKIRLDGEYVKVYGEVTSTFPLLVTNVFVPALREKLSMSNEKVNSS